jgi:hypothetical protein
MQKRRAKQAKTVENMKMTGNNIEERGKPTKFALRHAIRKMSKA